MKVVVLMLSIFWAYSSAFSLPTKAVEIENFNTPVLGQQNGDSLLTKFVYIFNKSTLNDLASVSEEKPAEFVKVNDSQTIPGKDRLPNIAIVVELDLEKHGPAQDTVSVDQILGVSAVPIDRVYQPPGPPERHSNKKGSYIATVSYGPNSPSLVYTCYSNNEVDASILNLPNSVQGPYGYVCTVVKGPPGAVTEIHTAQEPVHPVISGAVELTTETPQQTASVLSSTMSPNGTITQGNVYLNSPIPRQLQHTKTN